MAVLISMFVHKIECMKASVVASRKAILVRYKRRTIDVIVVLVYGQFIMQSFVEKQLSVLPQSLLTRFLSQRSPLKTSSDAPGSLMTAISKVLAGEAGLNGLVYAVWRSRTQVQ